MGYPGIRSWIGYAIAGPAGRRRPVLAEPHPRPGGATASCGSASGPLPLAQVGPGRGRGRSRTSRPRSARSSTRRRTSCTGRWIGPLVRVEVRPEDGAEGASADADPVLDLQCARDRRSWWRRWDGDVDGGAGCAAVPGRTRARSGRAVAADVLRAVVSASLLRWCTRKQLAQVNSSACLGSTLTVSSSPDRSAPGSSKLSAVSGLVDVDHRRLRLVAAGLQLVERVLGHVVGLVAPRRVVVGRHRSHPLTLYKCRRRAAGQRRSEPGFVPGNRVTPVSALRAAVALVST